MVLHCAAYKQRINIGINKNIGAKILKVLHTSDWHLGRTLHKKKERYVEFQQFLNWMVQTIKDNAIDILLIAGDIFDTTIPSNKAQEMYYQFLCELSINTKCQHIVIIGGNHDSPTLLNAPNQILKQLNIHVVGSITDNPEDEVILLKNKDGKELAFICAIPYLRDREVRLVDNGETARDKDLKLMQGIKEHYAKVCDIAVKQRDELNLEIPIIAMGHLFVAGGQTIAEDGVRELYIGSLAKFGANDFPLSIDYLALGHLHVPQIVNGNSNMRYSGSPIAMGFGEAKQQKVVLAVNFNEKNAEVVPIKVPVFQNMLRIDGDLAIIKSEINKLLLAGGSVWVEVIYTGSEIVADLCEQLNAMVHNSSIELLKIENLYVTNQIFIGEMQGDGITLSDFTPDEIFNQCLEVNQVDALQRDELLICYQQILHELNENDSRAI